MQFWQRYMLLAAERLDEAAAFLEPERYKMPDRPKLEPWQEEICRKRVPIVDQIMQIESTLDATPQEISALLDALFAPYMTPEGMVREPDDDFIYWAIEFREQEDSFRNLNIETAKKYVAKVFGKDAPFTLWRWAIVKRELVNWPEKQKGRHLN